MTLRIEKDNDRFHFEDHLQKFIEAYQREYGGLPKGEIEIIKSTLLSEWDYENDDSALVIFNNEEGEA